MNEFEKLMVRGIQADAKKNNAQQKADWQADVAELGDKAYTRWQVINYANGRQIIPATSNLEVMLSPFSYRIVAQAANSFDIIYAEA
jgi:hypothetical protein